MALSSLLPTSSLTLLCVYASTAILNAFLPGHTVSGYTLQADRRAPMSYKLNGLRVILLVGYLGYFLFPQYCLLFITDFQTAAVTACLLGLLASAAFYIRGLSLSRQELQPSYRAPTVDELQAGSSSGSDGKKSDKAPAAQSALSTADTAEFDSRGFLQHFYCGLSEFNPRLLAGKLDVKMWLYLVGAVQLQLVVFAAVQHSWQHNSSSSSGGSPSLAISSIAFCLSFFLTEYLWNERVHLWTYDIFRERIGFKLLWGCLFWYPFFYAVPLLPLIGNPAADISPAAAGLTILLYFSGWVLTRGANLQKFHCKLAAMQAAEGGQQQGGKEEKLWGIPFLSMRTVPGSKGRLLCGGFWGLSRHINYAGEILQAFALGLPGYLATGSPLSFLYCCYYIALFIPRVKDDDEMCARKYGEVWTHYKKLVPWAMVPGLW